MVESTERDTPDVPLNIHQRLLAARKAVKSFIDKDKIHEIRKDGKKIGEFPYISHDAVTAHIRDVINEHGILTWPTTIEHKTNGNRTELTVATSFINVDDPNDNVVMTTVGYGVDTSDKGAGKALSYAVKAAYLKALMLQSSEDIEAADIPHDPVEPQASKAERDKDKARQAYMKAANDLQLAIRGCSTTRELVALQRDNKDFLMEVPDVTREHFITLFEARKKELEPTNEVNPLG